MRHPFCQYSETARLKEVIIGRWEGYRKVEAYVERVNEDQQKGLPREAELQPEFAAFRQALESRGVKVRIPEYVGKFVYDQLTPRDLGVVIGNRFVLCNMARSSRRYECFGILKYLLSFKGDEPNILIPPSHTALLEGGDIVVDKGKIFAGISQRTNREGVDFLEKQFGREFEVIAVRAKSLAEGENVLHLDCAFNPVGQRHCLIYTDGFREIPSAIREDYAWIEVNRAEQAALATNVLSIAENTLISRKHQHCSRVNARLREIGFEVIEVPFDGAPSTGGSFRCCSLPLQRAC